MSFVDARPSTREVHPDERAAANVSRRQTAEEARKQRILNPKLRQFGVDTDALASQIAEKEANKTRESTRDAAYANKSAIIQHELNKVDHNVVQTRRGAAQNVDSYRAQFQTRQSRREYDLSDPMGLRAETPARVGDADPRLGASSMQVFEGEDLSNANRLKAQAAQQRAWLEQQIKEKQARMLAEQAEEKHWDQHSMVVGHQQKEVDTFVNEKNREMGHAVRDYNASLAAENSERARTTKAADDADNLEEVTNNTNSIFLNEDPSAERSMLGSNRKLFYNYKGMTADDRSAIFAENERQRNEMATARAEAKAAKEKEEAEAERTRLLLIQQERALERQRRETRVATATTQLLQADTARTTQRSFKSSQITTHDKEFYAQFGTTSR